MFKFAILEHLMVC